MTGEQQPEALQPATCKWRLQVQGEPAAFLVEGFCDGKLISHQLFFNVEDAKSTASVFAQHYPMVTTTALTRPQPAAQWVGLTDVEWMNIVNKNYAWHGMDIDEVANEVCKLTEAKLREKNTIPQTVRAAIAKAGGAA